MSRKTVALGLAALLAASSPFVRAADDDEAQVRSADTTFWKAYNACDMTTMGGLITADVEFYHDKGGLTSTREGLIESLRKGPCGDPKMHLRREAVDGSVAFHPMKGGYAILSGRHLFYVSRDGKPEQLDGQAEFTTLWKYDQGQWRMHRVLSYDHGPVPHTPPTTSLRLPATALAAFVGHYKSARVGMIAIAMDDDHLKLAAGTFTATLYPESPTRFFATERDLRFEFEKGKDGKVDALAVIENGVVSERA
ncbi:DUF4440 domain-containing protein [Luteibacter yeojuensis]|uniref:DUF4440 domain-containing protein n=1 Tax=Luteibacter yeojuensis TaxID=345309 RepID=A0A7X5TQG3_9GAMM|nr:DUF4440 domain-containing protein [Luteibacter yeojuensis]NID16516.1 DUF4440 domain-containing protein [Luteibacter yeojuensis]